MIDSTKLIAALKSELGDLSRFAENLDDLVIDAVLRFASTINNGGVEHQIEFLCVEEFSEEEIRGVMTD